MDQNNTTATVIPSYDSKPAPLPFGVVAGVGVDNYEGDGKEYKVTVVLSKKEAKRILKLAQEIYEDAGGSGKLPNKIVREGDNGDWLAYPKSITKFDDGSQNKIGLVDAKKNPLDPEQYGSFGGKSKGRVSVLLRPYGGKKIKGVSLILKAVQLSKFEELSSGGVSAFENDEGDAMGDGADFKDKKKKKKKK